MSTKASCSECRQAAQSNLWPPPRRLAVRPGPAYLHVCDFCGSYWEYASPAARPLTSDEAHNLYRDYFRGMSGSRRTGNVTEVGPDEKARRKA